MLDSEAFDEMDQHALALDEDMLSTVVQHSAFQTETSVVYDCGGDDPSPAIHWQLIDYGWGIVPSLTTVTVSGVPASESELVILYGMAQGFSRPVTYYEIIYQPSVPFEIESTHNIVVTLGGLDLAYSTDSDSDGLPDAAETTTNPVLADTDGDGLDDWEDPCPVLEDMDWDSILDPLDEDADGDGLPDPPFREIGYHSSLVLTPYSAYIPPRQIPDFSYSAFPTTDPGEFDRNTLIIHTEGCVPPEWTSTIENTAYWSIDPDPYVDITDIESDSDTILVHLDGPLPYSIIYQFRFRPLEWLWRSINGYSGDGSSGGQGCSCDLELETEVTNFCCYRPCVGLKVNCPENPCDFIVDYTVTVWKPEITEKPTDCEDSASELIDYAFVEVRTESLPGLPCGANDYFYNEKCFRYEYDFKLYCHPGSPSQELVDESYLEVLPDINPPRLDTWEFTGVYHPMWPGEPYCGNFYRLWICDRCWESEPMPEPGRYQVDVYLEGESEPISWRAAWHGGGFVNRWRTEDNDPNAWGKECDADPPVLGCTEYMEGGDQYWIMNPCNLCKVQCIKLTADDYCSNWRTKTISFGESAAITDISFMTPSEMSPPFTAGYWDGATWRQYVNLEKHGEPGPAVGGDCDTLDCSEGLLLTPDEWGTKILCSVRVTPPLAGVAVEWHVIDPWHKGPPSTSGDYHQSTTNAWNMGFWGQTGYEGIAYPLWDFFENHVDQTLNVFVDPDIPSGINPYDPASWDIIRDNFLLRTSSTYAGGDPLITSNWEGPLETLYREHASRAHFTPECGGHESGTNAFVSVTNGVGVAYAVFNTDRVGGWNYQLVAAVCGAPNAPCEVDPAVSEVIEVWFKAGVFVRSMAKDTPHTDPIYELCFDNNGDKPPLSTYCSEGSFSPETGLVFGEDDPFTDAFFDIGQLNGEGTRRDGRSRGWVAVEPYHLQVPSVPTDNCGICLQSMPGYGDSSFMDADHHDPYDYVLGAIDYLNGNLTFPSGNYYGLLPADMCTLDLPAMVNGTACYAGGAPRALVTVGEYRDLRKLVDDADGGIDIPNDCFDTPEKESLQGSAHELGHLIGHLPDQGDPCTEDDWYAGYYLFSTYGDWGRSIMHYARTARYFGPKEIYFMRMLGPQL